jgi:hypothetical protein
MTTNTFESLIRQDLTPAAAIAAGQLVLEGDRSEFDRNVQLLSAVCSGLRTK